jgi:glutamine cyclotransferase
MSIDSLPPIRHLLRASIGSMLCLLLFGTIHSTNSQESFPRRIPYKIVNTYPHAPGSFTQGLAYENGFLYEGIGQFGRSCLRKVQIETGKILKEVQLPHDIFGEGITFYKDRIIQLTWLSQLGFVYDKVNFHLLKTFRYPHRMEGWGITTDGNQLIMSDGSPKLYFLDPESFREKKRLEIYDQTGPVHEINELEYIEGDVYANVWQTSHIIQIDLQSGKVAGIIDLREIVPEQFRRHRDNVLNGIAYDPERKRIFVTGKMWPLVYEIEIEQENKSEHLAEKQNYSYRSESTGFAKAAFNDW